MQLTKPPAVQNRLVSNPSVAHTLHGAAIVAAEPTPRPGLGLACLSFSARSVGANVRAVPHPVLLVLHTFLQRKLNASSAPRESEDVCYSEAFRVRLFPRGIIYFVFVWADYYDRESVQCSRSNTIKRSDTHEIHKKLNLDAETDCADDSSTDMEFAG